mgnify:CR=1 FL=1
MGAEVKHALAQAEEDKRAVAIVLTGAGRGFCAGADLDRLKGISEGRREEELPPELDADPGDPAWGEDLRGTYTYLMSIPKPIIAAINGPIAGMAIPIALACDLRFASDRAIFTTAFSRRGLVAEWGIGWLLSRLMGPAHALDILFSARRFDAAEAERIGLVNRVLPHDELLPFVHGRLIPYLAELSGSPVRDTIASLDRTAARLDELITRLEEGDGLVAGAIRVSLAFQSGRVFEIAAAPGNPAKMMP